MMASHTQVLVKTSLPHNPARVSPDSMTHTPHHKFWLWDDTDNMFPPHRMFFLIVSFIFYLADVGLDVWVAVEYYIADRRGSDPYARYYLTATLFFIIIPALLLNFISWALYTWGWLVYRNRKLHGYCCSRLEQMRYIKQGAGRGDTNSVLLVEGVHVINWSGYQRGTANTTRQLQREKSRSLSGSPHKSNGDIELLGSEAKGNNDVDGGLEFYPLDFFDSCEYLAVTIIHLCLCGFLFRILRLLYTRGRDKYSFDRYRDISFLRLIESFLESAPQVVLQLYLLVVHNEAVLWYKIVTPISIIFSIVSLAMSVGDYISATKDISHYDPHPNAEKKPRLSWAGYINVIFWHLCMIVARGLAFSLFATAYGAYVFLIVGLHYLAMVYWMFWQHAHVFKRRPEDFDDRYECRAEQVSWKKCLCPCGELCKNYGIEFVAAMFNVFFHFKIRDGGAIITLIPFYFLSFVENAIMILLWYFSRDYDVTVWYSVPALVTVFTTFTFGIVLLSIYYLRCQPGKKRSLEPDTMLEHPTLTSTLNRMYEYKAQRGNFFKRTFSRTVS